MSDIEKYIVNMKAQSTGEHEVHCESCSHLPDVKNRLELGLFSNCQKAIEKAETYYNNVDGCRWCCSKCHTR